MYRVVQTMGKTYLGGVNDARMHLYHGLLTERMVTWFGKAMTTDTMAKEMRYAIVGCIICIYNITILYIMSVIDKKYIPNLDKLFFDFINLYEIEGFDSFQDLNTSINRGDCIKDGTNNAILDNFGLFMSGDFTKDDVKELANYTIEKTVDMSFSIPQEFSKSKKGDVSVKNHYIGMEFDVGFDSGLGLDNYLLDKQYKTVDTFGKYIDPSKGRDVNYAYPSKNTPLTITEEVFDTLGYENCSLDSAVNVGNDQYRYKMKLTNAIISYNGGKRNVDPNILTIFVGNKEKKKITDTNMKRAAIVGKSLGDKLQVFIMYIKKLTAQASKTKINCISTCDEIVTLFCVILGLPCFYTSYIKNKVNKEKVNRILYYNPENINVERIVKRFANEKAIVLESYKTFINMLQRMNQDSPVMVKEDQTKVYYYDSRFYHGLIDDLIAIKNKISTILISPSDKRIQDINKKLGMILHHKLREFIKPLSNGIYLLTRSNAQYNDYISLDEYASPYHKYNLMKSCIRGMKTIDLRSKTFFDIANKYAIESTEKVNGGSRKMKGGGGEIQLDDIFDMNPIIVYVKPDECLPPEDQCEQTLDIDHFDANASLFNEILELYNNYDNPIVIFEDIYGEMLYQFSINPDYHSEHIRTLMDSKMQELTSNILQSNETEKVITTTQIRPAVKMGIDTGLSHKERVVSSLAGNREARIAQFTQRRVGGKSKKKNKTQRNRKTPRNSKI